IPSVPPNAAIISPTRGTDQSNVIRLSKFAVTKGDILVGVSGEGHEIMGFAWAALIILHIAAALRHHLVLKDDVLRRMR
ncbi:MULTISPECIES: cytochrome b, partial [unclassified Sphingobium]|uniref:cytochrome b n=1 Tax=unclassified Sphingobium TaxID=2611147 RepID=UPI0035A739BB